MNDKDKVTFEIFSRQVKQSTNDTNQKDNSQKSKESDIQPNPINKQ